MTNRKQLLAAVRSGDYAHAGEEEAIEIAFKTISKNSDHNLLDVGCGLGGTAEYLRKNGWGKVTGIDIDPAMIALSQKHYPFITAHCLEASQVDSQFSENSFDVVYSFNAFFTFEAQEKTLNALSKVSKPSGKLVLFDYSAPGNEVLSNPFVNRRTNYSVNFNPIRMKSVKGFLDKTGWSLEHMTDLNEKYKTWYQDLISKMKKNESSLKTQFGTDTFQDLYEGYCDFLDLLKSGRAGGVSLVASKKV